MANSDFVSNPALTYTLDQFIQMKYSDEMTFRNFSIVEIVNDLEMIDHNLIEDYLDELDQICVNCVLDDEQFKKYKFAPDLLAYDVYGSTQIDFVIMYANGIYDPKEFTKKTIRLPYKSGMKTFLNAVYNANGQYIAQNRSDNGLNVY